MKKLGLLVLLCFLVCCKTKSKEEINVEVAYETKAMLGEGAFWNYKSEELYWVDIEGKKLHIFSPKNEENKTIEMPSRIGTVVPVANKNKAVVALEDGIYIVDTITKELSLLSNVESDIVENRFNDGKCDPNGNLWVGSMHLAQTHPKANLYKIDGFGNANKMLDNITISNGIVWTSDKKTMYYIDTPTGKIKAYDFDDKSNTIKNERVAVVVNPKDGFPDGMTIDENDMLWVGMWNGNAVANYNPNTGELIKKIEVPAHNVTSCAFGGENLDVLYITTASLDMTEEEQKKYPLAGSVFKVQLKEKGVKGSFFNSPNLKTAQRN
ncbi:sugar lactone lactonase YvrE [Tenacibaculum skagerrakense]|uniref:Sugar lactone lactonase YvrE n=1 Tax=Tenacibaculum skagerrakense TaxID=186571 RepID=A0A4R2NR87_9FLAO|nr:SMP-30/gluconolactonase/LRE family protein [Tenacibaculum skagerrakense]TCP24317.1 sugar lactone lactonase YvrE [Tenacibaculum skagerrakense]